MTQIIGFLMFLFTGFTILNRIMEGAFISAADTTIIKTLILFNDAQVLWWKIPVPNLSMLTVGVPKLIQWDYSFFGGPAAFFQYFLYAISAAAMITIIVVFLGICISVLAKLIPWG